MRKNYIIALLAIAAATFNAQAINVELGLAIDGSGSISAANFALQRNGYAAALAAEVPTDGSVAIGVWQFGSAVSQVFATTVISSAADLNNLIAAINGMTQAGGSTALGGAIQAAQTQIMGNAIDSTKQIIDVSTDGFGNIAPDQVTARNAALAAGIDQINGLLVGAGASSTFVGGTDAFAITIADFSTFQTAIENKLRQEIRGTPDAGSTAALMSLGFLCLAGFRRAFCLV